MADAEAMIKAVDGMTSIGRLINIKQRERDEVKRKLDVLDGEISALREAEYEIEKLGRVKEVAKAVGA